MIIYITLCCKKKRKVPLPIKSINRYISGRIQRIYQKSILDRVNFRIFSGKFGLLDPGRKIFWYDEKLTDEKVSSMTRLLQKQMGEEKVSKIIFFAYNLNKNRSWIPYSKALKAACKRKKIKLIFRYL